MKRCKIHKKKTSVIVRCYWANTERKEVFSLAQRFRRNVHMELARKIPRIFRAWPEICL